MKILLGQLGSNGDCLYATIIARQLRHDYPDAHISWAVSERYKAIPRNNPDVDEVLIFPLVHPNMFVPMVRVFEQQALRFLKSGEYDKVVYSQIWPGNFQHYDGTVRPSILRAYGAPITVPIENVLCLTDEENEGIANFVQTEGIASYPHRIIFECSSFSGQSFVTPAFAQQVAAFVYEELPDACVILSTHEDVEPEHPNTRLAGSLSLRQIAGLTHAATMFVGCGSGCTVAATSTAARQLPMIQVLKPGTSVYASFAHDFAYYGKPNDHIIETTDKDPATVAAAVIIACRRGVAEARDTFHEDIPVTFGPHYQSLINDHLLAWSRPIDAARSLMVAAERYGWHPDLTGFGREQILPRLEEDALYQTIPGRNDAEKFREMIEAA